MHVRYGFFAGLPWAHEVGKVLVQELDWYNAEHRLSALGQGPFDFLLAADCVYNEQHVTAFKETCLALMHKKSLCKTPAKEETS